MYLRKWSSTVEWERLGFRNYEPMRTNHARSPLNELVYCLVQGEENKLFELVYDWYLALRSPHFLQFHRGIRPNHTKHYISAPNHPDRKDGRETCTRYHRIHGCVQWNQEQKTPFRSQIGHNNTEAPLLGALIWYYFFVFSLYNSLLIFFRISFLILILIQFIIIYQIMLIYS